MKRRLIIILFMCTIAVNLLAVVHAYRFTHTVENLAKTPPPEKLSFLSKLKVLFFGIDLPKTKNLKDAAIIDREFKSLSLPDKFRTPVWLVDHKKSEGIVLIFHGYSGNRETMLPEAQAFYNLGYDVALLDFPGHGDSPQAFTTLGYREAEVVKTMFDYFKGIGRKKIYLYGASMGATAIMRAVAELAIKPNAVILDYPYYSLLATARKRFEIMGLKINFPLPELLTFWGGVINGFNAFGLNGKTYAKDFKQPALLCGGSKDARVPPEHLQEIHQAMGRPARLLIVPGAAHESLISFNPQLYLTEVKAFLAENR